MSHHLKIHQICRFSLTCIIKFYGPTLQNSAVKFVSATPWRTVCCSSCMPIYLMCNKQSILILVIFYPLKFKIRLLSIVKLRTYSTCCPKTPSKINELFMYISLTPTMLYTVLDKRYRYALHVVSVQQNLVHPR